MARFDLLAVALGGMVAQGSMRDVARTVTIGWTNHFTDRPNRATVHSFVGQAMSLGEISGGVVLGLGWPKWSLPACCGMPARSGPSTTQESSPPMNGARRSLRRQ